MANETEGLFKRIIKHGWDEFLEDSKGILTRLNLKGDWEGEALRSIRANRSAARKERERIGPEQSPIKYSGWDNWTSSDAVRKCERIADEIEEGVSALRLHQAAASIGSRQSRPASPGTSDSNDVEMRGVRNRPQIQWTGNANQLSRWYKCFCDPNSTLDDALIFFALPDSGRPELVPKDLTIPTTVSNPALLYLIDETVDLRLINLGAYSEKRAIFVATYWGIDPKKLGVRGPEKTGKSVKERIDKRLLEVSSTH